MAILLDDTDVDRVIPFSGQRYAAFNFDVSVQIFVGQAKHPDFPSQATRVENDILVTDIANLYLGFNECGINT